MAENNGHSEEGGSEDDREDTVLLRPRRHMCFLPSQGSGYPKKIEDRLWGALEQGVSSA